MPHSEYPARITVLSRLVSNEQRGKENVIDKINFRWSSPTVALSNNSNGAQVLPFLPPPTLSRELSRIRPLPLYETRSSGAPLLFPASITKSRRLPRLEGRLFKTHMRPKSKEISLCHTCACLVDAQFLPFLIFVMMETGTKICVTDLTAAIPSREFRNDVHLGRYTHIVSGHIESSIRPQSSMTVTPYPSNPPLFSRRPYSLASSSDDSQ